MTWIPRDIPFDAAAGQARYRGRAVPPRVALIILLAVVVRLAYCLLVIDPCRPPTVPGQDDWQYDYYATGLVEGRGIANADGTLTAQRMPGYIAFLAGLYWVFGHSLAAVRVTQCLLGGATCLLLYLLARRLTSSRAGLVAAGILALYPMHIWLSGEILSENLGAPGLLLLLLAMDQARRRPSAGRYAFTGLAAGAMGLVHPILAGLALVLGALTVAAMLLARDRPWQLAVLTPCITAIVLGGWAVRNKFAVGSFILSSLGGSTLLGANNVLTATDSRYYGRWVSEWDVPGVSERVGLVRDEADRSRLFREFALQWLRQNPRLWPRLAVFKLLRFYGVFLNDWRSPEGLIYLVSYGGLLPLTLLGAWGIHRRAHTVDRWGQRCLLLVLGYYTATIIIFWGAPRFRLTIEPLLILLAACALVRLAPVLRAWMAAPPVSWQWQLPGRDV